jgi:CRISPR-associated protein Cas6
MSHVNRGFSLYRPCFFADRSNPFPLIMATLSTLLFLVSVLPIHELENISIHPIAGIPEPSKQLRLTQRSKLQIRLPVDLIPLIYESLAGQTFSIGQHQFQLDIPEYNPLHPFPDLYSRLVIIRRFQESQALFRSSQTSTRTLKYPRNYHSFH